MKKFFLRASLVIVCAALLFLVGELLTRLAVQLPEREYEFDSLTGIRHVPNNVFGRNVEENMFIYTTNKAGFLDREYSIEKPPGMKRVVMLGDSITEGAGVDQNQRFSELLEQEFSDADVSGNGKVEILNFGVVETGTIREFLILKYKALLYNPDAVVLVFYLGDDIFDNYSINEEAIREFSAAQYAGSFRSLITHSHLAVLVIQQIRALDLRVPFPNILRKTLARFGILVSDRKEVTLPPDLIYPGFLLYAQGNDQRFVNGWNKTEEYFVKIRDELQQHNIPLFVFVLPSHEQIYPDVWERILDKYSAMRKLSWNLQKPNIILQNILRRDNINFTDTTPFFRSLFEQNHEQLFYPQDGHLTTSGHKLIAEIISPILAAFLKKQ